MNEKKAQKALKEWEAWFRTECKQMEKECKRLLAQVEQERQRAEKKTIGLERERSLLKAMVENTLTMLAYLSPQFNFVKVNSAYAFGSGYGKEELIGRNHFELFPNPENERIFERARETGQVVEFHAKPFEYHYQPWRGVTYWDWTLVPVKDEAGRVQGLVLSLQEVTKVVHAEEARRKAYDELEKRVQERTAELAQTNQELRLEIAERKQAQEKLQMRERQQEAVAELGQRALAGTHIYTLMDEAVALLAQTLEVEYAKVLELLPDGKALLLRAGVGWKEGYVGQATVEAGAGSQAGYTFASREPVILDDVRTETRFGIAPLLREHGVISGMSVIVSGRDPPFGILGAHTTRRRQFNQDDVNFLQAIANVLAMAIERIGADEERERLLEENRQMAEVAQERAAKLQSILDNMIDGVIVCDAKGRITLANESSAQLLGLSRPEDLKRPLAEFPGLLRIRHPDRRPMTPEELPLVRALAGETVVQEALTLYNRLIKRDVSIRTNAAPIRDEAGAIIGALEVCRDVTELTELDRLKDQFISAAAHELKTPVTGVKGYTQILLRQEHEGVTPRGLRILETIDRQADRITQLVNDLLDISRLQMGQLELAAGKIDLLELIERIIDRMALTTTKHLIRLVRAEPVVVEGDPDRLGEVLVNLIDNAIRFSPQGGDIDVSVTVEEHEVIVSVRDYGVGIPKSRQGRVFQRFYRAHTGTPYDYGGMGVGLYISREIISRHGGRMWFESEEGKGSIFYFSLPLG